MKMEMSFISHVCENRRLEQKRRCFRSFRRKRIVINEIMDYTSAEDDDIFLEEDRKYRFR